MKDQILELQKINEVLIDKNQSFFRESDKSLENEVDDIRDQQNHAYGFIYAIGYTGCLLTINNQLKRIVNGEPLNHLELVPGAANDPDIDPDINVSQSIEVAAEKSDSANESLVYRSLVDAYCFFAKFNFNWQGRDTTEGQAILANMKRAIEGQQVKDREGDVFRVSIDKGKGWNAVTLIGESGEKELSLHDLIHYNPII